ncbi:MAG TPA: transketolase C-terminal domain-containing protein [Jatrophihabitans sp.]|nr:transketolase C-terminal domain-containing protein [Jatrophihabitans sp.]
MLRAADRLATAGITPRVLDCYCVKPVDIEALTAAADATGRIVVAEDHHPGAGGSAVPLPTRSSPPAGPN